MKRRINLKKAIIIEYIIAVLYLLFSFLLFSKLLTFLIGDNTGIDGIGPAMAYYTVLWVIDMTCVLIIYLVIPIGLLIIYRQEIRDLAGKAKKIICIILILLPVLHGIGISLSGVIEDLKYEYKYHISDHDYSVLPEDYKTVAEFRDELEARGLYTDSEKMLSIMNDNPDHYYQQSVFSYGDDIGYIPASLIYDSEKNEYLLSKNVILPESERKYPYYVYRASLLIANGSNELQYASVFDGLASNAINNNYDCPYFDDYYIDCEILYVDGDLYAVIGLEDSYSVYGQAFEYEKARTGMYPYCMILSEKDTITTYGYDKYHGEGSITKTAKELTLNVKPGASSSVFEEYTIRKVDRLDVATINALAREMQDTVLRDSINAYLENK